jgi:hypothetical protein
MEKGKSWQLGLLRAIQPTRNPHTRAPAQLPLTRTRRHEGPTRQIWLLRLVHERGLKCQQTALDLRQVAAALLHLIGLCHGAIRT